MTNIQDLATFPDQPDARAIAQAAFYDDLASDYEALQGESGYRLTHPTNGSLSLVFDLEYSEDDKIDGWTYATYDRDEDGAWQIIGPDGDGLNADQPITDLLEIIENTLTEWAK